MIIKKFINTKEGRKEQRKGRKKERKKEKSLAHRKENKLVGGQAHTGMQLGLTVPL